MRPPGRKLETRAHSSAVLVLLPVLVLAACTRSPHAAGSGQGLVVIGGELFVPPELRDHEHGEADPDAPSEPSTAPAAPGGPDLHGYVRAGFHDFGRVPVGETARHTFRMRNSDPVPVTIQALDASCGCTIPHVSYLDPATGEEVAGSLSRTGEILVVPPGAEVLLELRIDTRTIRTKNVDKLVSVRLSTDSVNQAYQLLECHMVVDQPFRVVPERVDLGMVLAGQGGTGVVELFQDGTSGARATGVEEPPEGVLADLREEDRDGARRWVLEAGFEPPLETGYRIESVTLTTELPDGSPGAPFEVQVVGRIVDGIDVLGRLVLRGDPPVGEVDLRSARPDDPLTSGGVEVLGDWKELVDAELIAVSPDLQGRSTQWKLRLAARPGISDSPFKGTLRVRMQGQLPLEKEIPYVGFLP